MNFCMNQFQILIIYLQSQYLRGLFYPLKYLFSCISILKIGRGWMGGNKSYKCKHFVKCYVVMKFQNLELIVWCLLVTQQFCTNQLLYCQKSLSNDYVNNLFACSCLLGTSQNFTSLHLNLSFFRRCHMTPYFSFLSDDAPYRKLRVEHMH